MMFVLEATGFNILCPQCSQKMFVFSGEHHAGLHQTGGLHAGKDHDTLFKTCYTGAENRERIHIPRDV